MNLWPIAIAVAFILLYSYGRPAATWLYERSKRLRLPSLPSLPLGAQIPVWQALLIVVAVWASMGGLQYQGCMLPQFKLPWSIIAPKVTAAVYVYDKTKGGIPTHVGKAVSKLNERDILATTHEDGPGAVPKQYEFSVPAAREAGLPSFVTMASDRSVLKVVKGPATEQAVLEAAQ
jgi:hypothetical protein